MAHELAAHCLSRCLNPYDFIGQPGADIPVPDGIDPELLLVDEEMADGVWMYIEFVNTLWDPIRRSPYGPGLQFNDLMEGRLMIEQRVQIDYTAPDGERPLWGTADCIVMDRKNNALHIVDFKYGYGVVEATLNKQLMTYAVAALDTHGGRTFNPQLITLTIVQPRAFHKQSPIRTFIVDPIDLMDFRVDLTRAADATYRPDSILFAGEWCKYCPANGFCEELRMSVFENAKAAFQEIRPGERTVTLTPAEFLTPEQAGQVLAAAKVIEAWVDGVRKYWTIAAQHNQPVPGYKLTDSLSRRRFINEQDTLQYMRDMGYSDAELFQPAKLRSAADMEKHLRLPKGFFKDMTTRDVTGVTLVPADSEREEIPALLFERLVPAPGDVTPELAAQLLLGKPSST